MKSRIFQHSENFSDVFEAWYNFSIDPKFSRFFELLKVVLEVLEVGIAFFSSERYLYVVLAQMARFLFEEMTNKLLEIEIISPI